ncbi:FeoB small GTPase domain-containing protein [Clostridium sp. AWRP]|uniref:FeoB small GTPase domain-containing protein n=1 Tax=Clostridium sp. AWRP TaxID=2212991 RepID=UPI000FD6C519|nr:FeoB small GTPase domain-containing protein [Clostridium sp. AWRP]AZV56860.1 ferrous iron transporter B [Clostridium sp. AWRP]
MKKVILAGNPNVGKSLIFSRMTRIRIATANYAGTTVEMKTGKCRYKSNEYEIIDGPGIYSLEKFSKTDEIALQLIDEADIIIDIIDSTNLERNLNLTLQLLQKKKPTVVCLNFWDDTVHKGITIDVQALEKLLGVPVIPVSALRSEGISKLLDSLAHAKICNIELNEAERWNLIGSIIKSVQKLSHRHHTLLERISDFTLHPVGGIITAIFVLVFTLIIVRFLGEGLINGVFEPFYSHLYNPLLQSMVKRIPILGLREILVGNTAYSDPLQSFGILTSGVYIALVSVFPYFFSFYLVFGFLEDFGYLPRLSVVFDKFFHHLGLHGYSSIPVMLGLGCKVPAFMATRSLTNRREKILTITLIFMSAPCLSQSAMIVSLGMNYGVLTVITIYAILIFLAIGMNVLMNKFYKNEDSIEFFTEFPACRIPSIKLMAGKLWIRISEYFAEVLPMIAIGVLVMNVLSVLHVLSFIIEIVKWPTKILFGLPAEIAPIMLLNFLRKDASVALLVPLNLTAPQFICACIFLTLSTPCLASFFTMIKELSTKTTLKIVGLILMISIIITTLLHLLFTLIL